MLSGSTPPNVSPSRTNQLIRRAHCAITSQAIDERLDLQLRKFWEIEDVSFSPSNPQLNLVEEHFVMNTTRDASGRYVVTLPKEPNCAALGSSKSLALKRFFSLERRLSKDSNLRQDYVEFMKEYESLGHMQLAKSNASTVSYHIPHRPVFKSSRTSTNLRVVFDACAPSSSGLSLNDILQVGPTVQPDLLSIVFRFRTKDVAMVADIVKMYRQVKVSEEDYDLQRIFWRSSPDLPLQEYQLITVTYGTAPAAFLATRALNQLIFDEGEHYPLAAPLVNQDFYVDDFISCCNDASHAILVYHQLTSMLLSGGFELRKWATNSAQLLNQIPLDHRAVSNIKTFDDSSESPVHTLGLLWHTDQDMFKIQYRPPAFLSNKPYTKRLILSTVASIFHPLGFIAPVIVLCKIFVQRLWLSKLSWDEPICGELSQVWSSICSKLPDIIHVAIPRLSKPLGLPLQVYLHVFADASSEAYGAVAYLIVFTEGDNASHLILAKSKVAPLKPLTIPRLELSAALLAARLSHKIHVISNFSILKSWLWSDSTIVLSWMRRQPREFNSFVASRLAEIDELTHQFEWLHVPTKDNPADLISRGTSPKELIDNPLWWHGPNWLTQPQCSWPIQPALSHPPTTELKHCHVVTQENDLNRLLLTKYGSYLKVLRIMTYILRFVHNVKVANRSSKLTGPLSPLELDAAFIASAKIVQSLVYPLEIAALAQGKLVPPRVPF